MLRVFLLCCLFFMSGVHAYTIGPRKVNGERIERYLILKDNNSQDKVLKKNYKVCA